VSDSTKTNKPDPGTNEQPAQTNTPLLIPPEVEDIWRECEARLKLLRSDLEKLRTNSAGGSKPANSADEAKMQQVVDILTSLAKDPFSLIERDFERARKEAQSEHKPASNETPPRTNSTPAVPRTPASKSSQPNATNSNSSASAPNLDQDDGVEQLQDAQNMAQAVLPSVSASTSQAPSSGIDLSPFTGAVADGAQTTQSAAAGLLAALEQNTQMTASLFSEMLSLIETQDRQLGEVDRKISDLNGQINSLKNP